jgi:hypothetical protein
MGPGAFNTQAWHPMTTAIPDRATKGARRMLLLLGLLVTAMHAPAQVELRFTNRTGHRIEALTFAGIALGDLAPDSTRALAMDEVLLCGERPCMQPTGLIAGLRMDPEAPGWCGTKSRRLHEGRSEVCIHLTEEFHRGRELRLAPCAPRDRQTR